MAQRLTITAVLALLVAAAPCRAAPADADASPRETVNRLGMAFVLIPAGRFHMGSGDGDPEASAAEKPRHQVSITRAFYLARHEVTQAQWEAVMGRSPYEDKRSNPYYGLPGMAERLRRPDHPATVSWNDAQAFIRRLNQLEGHQRYRLPTEAEWEYAARAGTTTAYSFGDDVRQLGRHAWFGEDFGEDNWRVRLVMASLWIEVINRHGGNATLVHLPDIGVRGNTHFPFADLNNVQIADLMSAYLAKNGLE